MAQWAFKRFTPGDKARESQVEKFFKSDVVADRATAVVREGIQNSLDAAAEKREPIIVRLSVGERTPDEVAPYIGNLFEHLDAVRTKLPHIPHRGQTVRFLTFEDFNTTGLEGDPEQWRPRADANAFFNFFRGEGVTEKSDDARGRHGVGKMVFAVASRARCLYGLTVRSDGKPLLMGTSILRMHDVDGTTFHPDGWFGEQKEVAGGRLAVPIRDFTFIESFRKTFGLARTGERGLSIVVPWLELSLENDSIALAAEDLVRAVVEGYFWPILRGELTVHVSGPTGDVEISAATIAPLVEKLPEAARRKIAPLLSLSQWAMSLGDSDVLETKSPPPGAQRWDASLATDEIQQRLRSSLEQGERVALKVPMLIRRQGTQNESAHFHIYMERDPAWDQRAIFIREGLIISDVRPKRTAGYRALVIVDEGPLGRFLGDAENPAHTEWQKENVHGRYSFHASCIDFVVQSVWNVLRILSDEEKEADPTLLLDLFSLPATEPEWPLKQKTPKPKKPGGKSEPTHIDIPPKPKRFALHKLAGGFAIRRGDPEAVRPAILDVRMAYGVRRKNAFNRYRPADFRLGYKPIEFSVEGAQVLDFDDNRLRVRITDDDFEIKVTGFDTNRDLHIDPRAKDPEPGEIEATEELETVA